jgi:molybdopterin synthase sulfur carrier subunit
MGVNLQVSFYAGLRQAIGQKTADFSFPAALTVKELVQEIVLRYPGLNAKLTGVQGELLPHYNYLINGRDVRYLDGKFDTLLDDGDQVSIFPAVGGG